MSETSTFYAAVSGEELRAIEASNFTAFPVREGLFVASNNEAAEARKARDIGGIVVRFALHQTIFMDFESCIVDGARSERPPFQYAHEEYRIAPENVDMFNGYVVYQIEVVDDERVANA